MTMPDERLRALGEMRRLLQDILDPTSHISEFGVQLPKSYSVTANAIVGYYPSYDQMAKDAVSDVSQSRWLWRACPDSRPEEMYGLQLRMKKRFHGLSDARSLLMDIAVNSQLLALDNTGNLFRSIRFVLRHYPERWQLDNASRNQEPLSAWIKLDGLPNSWVDRLSGST